MTTRYRPPMSTLALDQARTLRSTPTDVEHLLWQHLRAGRMAGAKFRRQHSIPPYFVDFYCHAHRLVIEIDGSQHGEDVDRARTRFLEAKGLKVVRFSNFDVLDHRDAVLEAIWNMIAVPPLSPTPLPAGEGL